MNRVGIGWDAHRFAEGGELVLGGVTVPGAPRLDANSDGDVLVHAICDAILGGAGLGDLGSYFPDTDPKYKNISSLELLAQVRYLVADEKFTIINIDSVIVAQKPRVAEYLLKMKQKIADTLQLKVSRVGVKAASPEGLGAVGAGDGIEARAVALLNGPK